MARLKILHQNVIFLSSLKNEKGRFEIFVKLAATQQVAVFKAAWAISGPQKSDFSDFLLVIQNAVV